jgi:hypothetical protein
VLGFLLIIRALDTAGQEPVGGTFPGRRAPLPRSAGESIGADSIPVVTGTGRSLDVRLTGCTESTRSRGASTVARARCPTVRRSGTPPVQQALSAGSCRRTAGTVRRGSPGLTEVHKCRSVRNGVARTPANGSERQRLGHHGGTTTSSAFASMERHSRGVPGLDGPLSRPSHRSTDRTHRRRPGGLP